MYNDSRILPGDPTRARKTKEEERAITPLQDSYLFVCVSLSLSLLIGTSFFLSLYRLIRVGVLDTSSSPMEGIPPSIPSTHTHEPPEPSSPIQFPGPLPPPFVSGDPRASFRHSQTNPGQDLSRLARMCAVFGCCFIFKAGLLWSTLKTLL